MLVDKLVAQWRVMFLSPYISLCLRHKLLANAYAGLASLKFSIAKMEKRPPKRKGGAEREKEKDNKSTGKLTQKVQTFRTCLGGGGFNISCFNISITCRGRRDGWLREAETTH